MVASTSWGSRLRLVNVMTWPPASEGMKQPIHNPVPCISGAHGIDTTSLPVSATPLMIGPTSAASSGGATPSSGNPLAISPRVIPPIVYITPFGMPVVPPV